MNAHSDAAAILGPDGPFVERLPRFRVRPSQREMAAAIEEALRYSGTLVAESGTGTGKTYAYLVPALLSGQRLLISTGTKHLQEQLFFRDIPEVREVVNASVRCTLLKGRANYLCIDRLQQTRAGVAHRPDREAAELERIHAWSTKTRDGDIAEVEGVDEDSRIWPQVTSTVENCIGGSCAHFDDCYVNRARKRAQEHDIVVINHHLFFADLALKEDGFGKLLPPADSIIFDEAHQIPDIASGFMGVQIGGRQINELAKDVELAEARHRSAVPDLLAAAAEARKRNADLRAMWRAEPHRQSWAEALDARPEAETALADIVVALEALTEQLEAAAPAGEALARCLERAVGLNERCASMLDTSVSDSVQWLETTRRSYRLVRTPLHVGAALGDVFGNADQGRVFTSATLSVNGDFSHFLAQIGVGEVDTRTWDSPFDFANHALLYLPEGTPDPRDEHYADGLIERVLPVLRASRGRAFLLFTSYRMLHDIQARLSKTSEFELLTQGGDSKQRLLRRFQSSDHAVLLATMGFWEGVDVPGDSLSVVVIDKLPFESPGDPVLRARLQSLEQSDVNPFMDYQLPRAVISLRQGAGRLIRDHDDTGVLMICDPRVTGARYGKRFLDSLPPMRRTRDIGTVVEFLS